MKLINIIKILGIIGLLFLLPSITNAQIQRVWSIPEYTSTMLPPPATGAKVAYRTLNNSLFYWNGTVWKRIAGPGIVDTNYTLSFTSPNLSLVGSGSSVSLTDLYTAGWGLTKTAEDWKVDSSKVASKFYTNSIFFPLKGGTLTGTGGEGFVGFPSQVSAPGTPASGLNIYAQGSSFNWKGTDGFERQITSSLTGGRSYALPNASGTFALGTGTADRSGRWTGTNTLAAGNITDNGTKLQALLPWQFQDYTTAGLPTGVTGYHVYNTTTNGPGWYQGSRWAYTPESTVNRFTATRIPYADANGQLKETSFLRYVNDYTLSLGGGNANTSLSLAGSAEFRLTDNLDFKVTNVDGNNTFEVIGSNSRKMGFVPNSGNFFATGSNGSILSFDNGGAFFGFNLTAFTRNSITFPENSLFIGLGQTFGNTVITDQDKFPIIRIKNPTAAISNLDIYGGKGTGTNTAMSSYPLQIIAPLGSGNGTPGDINILTADKTVSGSTLQSATLKWIVKGDGGYFSNTDNPSYLFHLQSTNAIGLPRGTVGNQPAIAANTTPLRFFTDTAAIGYGDGGIYNFLATRPYVRGLVNSASNIYNSSGTITSNRVVRGVNRRLSLYDLKFTPMLDSSRNVIALVSRLDTTLRKFGSDALNPNWGPEFEATIIGGNFGSDTAITQKGRIGGSIFIGTDRGYIEGGNNSYWDVVVGHSAKALSNSPKRTAIGAFSLVSGADGTAIGYNSKAYRNSLALGSTAQATGDKTIVIGSYSNSAVDSTGLWGYRLSNTSGLTIKKRQFYYGIGGGSLASNQAHHIMYGKFSVGLDSALTYDPVTDVLQLSKYGTFATNANAISKTESGRVAGFATDGTVVSTQIIRDTLVAVNTNFSVSTLLNTCHHLHITTSLNIFAPNDLRVTLPTPTATLRGKQVTVYNESDASVTYFTIIEATGGASDLYYTTTTTTAPTAQTSIFLDGTTWPHQGASYTFTCKLLSGGYRWVLKQR